MARQVAVIPHRLPRRYIAQIELIKAMLERLEKKFDEAWEAEPDPERKSEWQLAARHAGVGIDACDAIIVHLRTIIKIRSK